jgi:hypothetical protein
MMRCPPTLRVLKRSLMTKPCCNCLHVGDNYSRKAKRRILLCDIDQNLSHGVVMLSPIRMKSVELNMSAEPRVPDGLATLSRLRDELSVARAPIARRRTLCLLIGANILVWILVLMIVQRMFF